MTFFDREPSSCISLSEDLDRGRNCSTHRNSFSKNSRDSHIKEGGRAPLQLLRRM